MNVALYVRVSTNKQEVENQLVNLRNFASKNNWNISKEYVDFNVSGKLDKRPQFDLMFQEAHKRLFDLVLFWDISRFSRSGTLFTLQKLKELENLSVKWHSYQEPYFSSIGEFKDVVLSIMSTLAKIEREKISRNTKAGLQRLKREGKKLGRPKGSKDKKNRKRSCFRKD